MKIRPFMMMAGLIGMLAMAGCSDQPAGTGQPAETKQTKPAETPLNEEQPKDGGPSAGKAVEPPAAQPPEAQPPAQPSAEPPAAEPPAAKYRINSIFDVVHIDEQESAKLLLLTFDDGPKEQQMLLKMLDVLDKYEAKAIFFVNGFRVKQNPELLKLIDARGQTIGNHAWDHINLKKLTPEQMDKQLGDVQQIVKETVGREPRFFRPPFGAYNDALKEKVSYYGMTFMNWSIGSRDWERGYNTPNKVKQEVLNNARPGGNILMHELPWTAEALDSLLSGLQAAGYTFADPRLIESTK